MRTTPRRIGNRLILSTCTSTLGVSSGLLSVFPVIHCPADAKFNYQLSEFNDPNFGRNNFTIRKVIAMNQHLKTYFLRRIKDSYADILYSIVISKNESDTRPRYAFFDADFHSTPFVWSRYTTNF